MTPKKQVQARAKELIKKLGKGWHTRVWFNLYWCYAAQDKSCRINVYPDNCIEQNTKYNCLISNTPDIGGLSLWTDRSRRSYRDPVRVVKEALKHARNCINDLDVSLKVAEDSWAKSRIANPHKMKSVSKP
jgi:hypothetical protein